MARRAEPAGRPGTTASRAFGWSFLNTLVGRLGTLAIGIALARMLGPDEFGTFAVATVALLAVLSFNELGVSLAIVRWRSDPQEIAPTVTTLSVAMSTVLTVAVWFVAPAFSAAMGDPSATPVVRVMGLSVLINGLVATPAAVMQREFMQKQRLVVDQVNTWLGALVSLVLVLAGGDAMSLAVGRVAGSVVAAVLFLRLSPLPLRFGLDRALLAPLLRFGLPLAGSSVVVFAGGYADQLITGRLLGHKALGFYVLAFNLASWPVTIFSQPLRSVAPAAFARQQHDPAAMNRSFVTLLGLVAAVTVPACLGIAGTAGALVALAYRAPWAPAAPILLVLAATAVIRIGFELSYDYLVVRGKSRAILWVQLVWVVAMVPALIAGARLGGTVGVALGQLAVALVVVVPLYLLLLTRCGLRVGALIRVILIPLAVGLAVGVSAYLLTPRIEAPLLACLVGGALSVVGIAVLLPGQRSAVRTFRDFRSGPDPTVELPEDLQAPADPPESLSALGVSSDHPAPALSVPRRASSDRPVGRSAGRRQPTATARRPR